MKGKMKLKVKERLEDVKEFILNNKVKVITISSLILMLIVATVVYIMITNEDTDTVVEYGDFEKITKVDEPEEVLLDVNTDGLQEGEEVAIITDEETGKVTIVSTSDPKFEEKTAGKTVTKGKVTSEGVKVNKDDSNDTIIDIATKPKDEQEENVVIEPPVEVPEEKPEDDKNDNKDDNKDDNKPTDDNKNEGNSGSTSGNTGNSGSSSGSSDKNDNKPSKPANDDKDEKPSKPSKPSEDDKDEKPSKDPTPTGEFIYKHNSTIENQIIAKIQSVIDNDEILTKRNTKITHGTAGKGHGFTYRGINSHDWIDLITGGRTNYVYVVDIYCVYSDGSTVKTNEVEVYVY